MQLAQDSCLYIKHANGHFSVLSLHVDDILQATTNIELYKELQRALINAYGEVTVQPEATSYLGMTITRSHCKGYVRLTQCGLIDKVVKQYPTVSKRVATTPACPTLTDPVSDETHDKVDRNENLGIIMTLMYIARLTRPLPHGHGPGI
jgi:hypothetical protein